MSKQPPHESHASAQEAQEARDDMDERTLKLPPPHAPEGRHAPEAHGKAHGKDDSAVKPPGRSPSHSVTVGGGFKLCFNTETETFCVLEGTREVPLACVTITEAKSDKNDKK